ncbi:MAG: ABC transporter permease [Halanaerobiales bacterium]|nr:ABC transporter permease [Halanaerobiales bacterium]
MNKEGRNNYMSFYDKIKLALTGVGSNKFRSFLTLLGIIIGVSSVILMVSLGSGTRAVVSGQFESISTRQVYLSSNWNLSYSSRGHLSKNDENYLENASSGNINITPFYRSYQSIEYLDKSFQATTAGVRANALELTNLKLKYGRTINENDIQGRKNAVVISEYVLSQLSNKDDYSEMIGEEITIGDQNLTIVGILGESTSTLALSNNSALLPITTYNKIFPRGSQYYDFMLVEYGNNIKERDLIAQINYLLNNKYGTVNGKNRFNMEGLQGRVELVNQITSVLTYLLGGIATISLLVGGIGVMNIMLVSVKERTREIGLRKAIGATNQDVQHQFLFESIILAVGGGIIGIILGMSLSLIANYGIGQFFEWWKGSIPLWVIMLSFGVTVAIGLIFGFYPAYKASQLDPIEALRYD